MNEPTKYRIKKVFEKPKTTPIPSDTKAWVEELMDVYGLRARFTLEEAYLIWTDYSEVYAAGWLNPTKQTVQEAFGVELEEIPPYVPPKESNFDSDCPKARPKDKGKHNWRTAMGDPTSCDNCNEWWNGLYPNEG